MRPPAGKGFPHAEAQEARRLREWQRATFEEKYGPWICMGCGMAHEIGMPCSEGDLKASEDVYELVILGPVDAT